MWYQMKRQKMFYKLMELQKSACVWYKMKQPGTQTDIAEIYKAEFCRILQNSQ